MENITKVVHIHTDIKFVFDSKRFEGDIFDNTIIIFKSEENYNGPYHHSAKLFDREQIEEVIEICKQSDLVVLYDLDILKSIIALSLPKYTKIAWRFFGYELYKRMENEILSQKSRSFLFDNHPTRFPDLLGDLFRFIYYKFKYGGSTDDLFYKAIDRLDFMMVISKLEHKYLSLYWKNLPEYIELSIETGINKGEFLKLDLTNKKNKVVVGNNRSIYNNHLEVIDIVEKTKNKEKYQYEFLFNYGSNGNYADAVRLNVKGKSYFRLIEDFFPKNEFDVFYDDVSALVINSYRQIAMDNIFLALQKGVKLYLNKKNIMMEWLLGNGIKVYSIDCLAADIEGENICLDENTMRNNYKCLKKLYESYSHEDFQEKVYSKIIVEDE